ncbi:ataxin-2 homolog isoform X2 [Eupeodes corollae]|uniref:ataxin-2 homolog isoform X2 n=1 Tax=Eupeodes corollae TaxID=290404 RepID=UPI0024926B21|nr:ataxin-2 homolog isoform X2 [Eupeodes corollae]
MKRYPSDNRQPKGKSVQAQGVYNNTYFMHAATALVGNLVQVHLRSGNLYEGVFRTFSPNFDIALELPFCIKSSVNMVDEETPVPNCMIFTSDNVVSIVAKDFDPNYATGGAFQTDNAISEKFVSHLDEKELEPWDASGMNGEIEFDLNGGANGWDANDMFIKNEKTFGVQSTFDDSLSDYTVQIEKRETEEFKEAEAKAEKLAQEIEKNPLCRERLDLENGDEEALFAAVERPVESNGEDANMTNKTNNASALSRPLNTNIMPQTIVPIQHHIVMAQRNNNAASDKFVQIPKRKAVPTNNSKTVRPSMVSNAVSQQSSSNTKLNYQTVQIQGTTSFSINQGYSPIMAGSTSYRHQGNVPQTKLNGDIPNVAVKNNSQRMVRTYGSQCYVEYNPQQITISKSIIGSGSAGNVNVQETNNSPPLHTNHTTQQTGNLQVGNQPPLPQRPMRARDDQIQDLRKFQQDFQLSGINPPNSQHQIPLNTNKSPNLGGHQAQQSRSPPQPSHQHNTPHNPTSMHNHAQLVQPAQMHHLNIKQTDNSHISQPLKSAQFSHSNQSQEKSIYQNHSQQIGKQTSPVASPGTSINDSGMTSSQANNKNSSNTNNMNNALGNNVNKNNTDLLSVEKTTPKTAITKKTHVLNPSAKPFTPRSPSTPNPSRPHTPQTPVQSINGIYSTGAHVGNSQASFYLMQPQQHTHPNAVQPPRLRRGPVATSQMHVSAAAATGQPLLTAAPMQQFIHYQQATHPTHFSSQPYQPMMRMFHEPPPQSIQFLAQTPPSTTPSPGQPHQQFHPPPQPSPAGGGPQTTFGSSAQPYHVMCPVIHPQLVPNYYHQGTPQNHHQQYQILMPQHPAQ